MSNRKRVETGIYKCGNRYVGVYCKSYTKKDGTKSTYWYARPVIFQDKKIRVSGKFLSERDAATARESTRYSISYEEDFDRLPADVLIRNYSKYHLSTTRPGSVKTSKPHIERILNYPTFGYRSAYQLKLTDWRGFERYLRDNYPLGNTTISDNMGVLKSAFNWAAQEDYIIVNPFANCKLPRRDKPKINPLSHDEAELLMSTVVPIRERAIIAICVCAGLRLRECMGLDWKYVNLIKKEIDVVQQADRHTGGVTSELKTEASRNWVPITPKLQRVLNEYWLFRGKPKKGLLFTSSRDKSRPLEGDLWRYYYYYPLLEKHKIEKRTVHDLRHTCITHLIDDNTDPMTVQRIARHAKLSTTLDIYAHWFRNDTLERMKSQPRKSEKKSV
jgi:integrase